jgi:hypothetical protein
MVRRQAARRFARRTPDERDRRRVVIEADRDKLSARPESKRRRGDGS